MDEIKYIDLKQQILSRNKNQADAIRQRLAEQQVFLLNLMSSPGSGKTTLVIETLRRLRQDFRIGVIEGDIESMVDSRKIQAEGVPAVQLRTGDACHLDAPMIGAALETMELEALDVVLVENIGNLVCPAEFDIGAAMRVMILSVPEGDDKIQKYPLMFSVVDALIISKLDYLPYSNFDRKALRERMARLNPGAKIFEVSCRTGEGVDEWSAWLGQQAAAFLKQVR
jgi:hydrogenase nickel incorporation protein HypB